MKGRPASGDKEKQEHRDLEPSGLLLGFRWQRRAHPGLVLGDLYPTQLVNDELVDDALYPHPLSPPHMRRMNISTRSTAAAAFIPGIIDQTQLVNDELLIDACHQRPLLPTDGAQDNNQAGIRLQHGKNSLQPD
jgi:hypothetical protein